MTKAAERFANWLKMAMPRAGLELEGQMAGGRATLADAVGVSRSTVKRWLDGDSLPEPTKFEAIANRLGVPVVEMLVETGIISIEAAGLEAKPNPTPQDAVRALGITEPADIDMVIGMVDLLRARLEAAPKFTDRSFTQRGVGGLPRPHEVKANETEE